MYRLGIRLWILHHESPSRKKMYLLMAALLIVPAGVGSTFTLAQADDSVVRAFLLKSAPDYLLEKGALTGHSGFTPHLIFTILIMIGAPWPLYIVILVFRYKILCKLRRFSMEMSERTRSMHRNLVRALTIHAMLPPIYFIGVGLYLVLYFDIYRHAALEKAIYTVNALPTAFAAFCTIHYVEPYRRFLSFNTNFSSPKISISVTQSITVVSCPVPFPQRKISQRDKVIMSFFLGIGFLKISEFFSCSMETALDRLNQALPVIHGIMFLMGFSNNTALLIAAFMRAPPALRSYSVMIKVGALNDFISVICDTFAMQRMILLPGNMLYLSEGPCSLISARACYLTYCMQMCSQLYTIYVITASFGFRLWILDNASPRRQNVLYVMLALYSLPAFVVFLFSFAQAEDSFVRMIINENSSLLISIGSCHYGFTPLVMFVIAFCAVTPGISRPATLLFNPVSNHIIAKLGKSSPGMSDRTRKMHRSLVKALTVHALLPPINVLAVAIYFTLFFDIYRHPALERATFTVSTIPSALAAYCTLCYVEPYRRFIMYHLRRFPMDRTASVSAAHIGKSMS
ncbi:hypothetical protein PRIPAC_87785, partial [Pristionchus pacificus]|uniref:G protein-coupled receptor n=1 Tax=Pristionchus pacificus TaxID=54126 RepID=A0A2A6B7F4_PRIPA